MIFHSKTRLGSLFNVSGYIFKEAPTLTMTAIVGFFFTIIYFSAQTPPLCPL